MSSVQTFIAPIEDAHGGRWEGAVAAIWAVSQLAQTTGKADDAVNGAPMAYEVTPTTISYHANFWYSELTQLEDKPSRPLQVNSEHGLTSVIEVDLTRESVVKALTDMTILDSNDRVYAAAQADLIARFSL